MSDLNGREVIIARLRTNTHIQGFGNMGPVLDPNSIAKGGLGTVKMVKVDGGLYISGNSWEGFIPDSSLVSIQFKPL